MRNLLVLVAAGLLLSACAGEHKKFERIDTPVNAGVAIDQQSATNTTWGVEVGKLIDNLNALNDGKVEGTIGVFNQTDDPGACTNDDIWIDSDAATGQRIKLCEAGAWVTQFGTGGGGTFDEAGTYDLTGSLTVSGTLTVPYVDTWKYNVQSSLPTCTDGGNPFTYSYEGSSWYCNEYGERFNLVSGTSAFNDISGWPGTVDASEVATLDGAKSNIQQQIDQIQTGGSTYTIQDADPDPDGSPGWYLSESTGNVSFVAAGAGRWTCNGSFTAGTVGCSDAYLYNSGGATFSSGWFITTGQCLAVVLNNTTGASHQLDTLDLYLRTSASGATGTVATYIYSSASETAEGPPDDLQATADNTLDAATLTDVTEYKQFTFSSPATIPANNSRTAVVCFTGGTGAVYAIGQGFISSSVGLYTETTTGTPGDSNISGIWTEQDNNGTGDYKAYECQ